MRQLEQSGALESTYILFLSDNGYFLGEHRQPHGKDAPYDAASRVPLMRARPRRSRRFDRRCAWPLTSTCCRPSSTCRADARRRSSMAAPWSPILAGQDRDGARQRCWKGSGKRRRISKETSPRRRRSAPCAAKDVLYVEYETGERELYNLRKDPYRALEPGATGGKVAAQGILAPT